MNVISIKRVFKLTIDQTIILSSCDLRQLSIERLTINNLVNFGN